jgi:CBS domain-containing protein
MPIDPNEMPDPRRALVELVDEAARPAASRACRVKDVMTTDVVTVDSDAPLREYTACLL